MKASKNKSILKDWQLIIVLLCAFLFVCLIGFFSIQLLDEPSFNSVAITQVLTKIQILSIGLFLTTLFAVFLLFKTTKQQKNAERERYEKQREQDQSYRLMNDLFHNAPIGFHSTDANNVFLEMNQTELDWLGYTNAEVVGKMRLSDISSRNSENIGNVMEELKLTGKLDNIEGHLVRKDGSLMPCLSNSRVLFDEDGNLLHTRVALMDTTESMKMRNALQIAKEETQEANKLIVQKQQELEKSYSLIHDLFDNSPIGVHSINAEGVFLEMNQTALDWLGYTRKELVGNMNLLDILTIEAEELKPMWEQISNFGTIDNLEANLVRKDGSILPSLSNSRAFFDEDGNLGYVRVAILDNTENLRLRKELKLATDETQSANVLLLNQQKELEHNLSFIHDLYDNAPIGFLSTEPTGKFLEINQTCLDWLGYEREEVIGKINLFDLTAIARKEIAQIKEILMETGKIDNVKGQLLCKDGSYFSFISNIRMVLDNENKAVYSRIAIMDYTENKKLEEELVNARQIAEKSSQLKEKFVANMSHEIRTPLNAIIGFSTLLKRTHLNQSQKEFTKSIQSSSENLLAIINDVLDFSKIEAGALRIEKIPFSPVALIRSLESMFRYKTLEKKLTFTVQLADDLPEVILGDPHRLTQILVNLLGNALKFTQEGEVKLSVERIKQENKSISIRFKVYDTGIGIPIEKQETIFNRFEQATTENTRRFGGSGLGLTITKQLVDLQNGLIKVQSIEGKETTFIIEIPYELMNENEIEVKELKQHKDLLKYKNTKILVAEDNRMNRRILELIFEDWSFKVDFAENGKIALDLLEQNGYDLILMDLQMPEMDGYTATQIIREELNISIPIIAITAHAFAGEREKCIHSGMNDYLSKPIDVDKLAAMIMLYSPNKFIEDRAIKPDSSEFIDSYDGTYLNSITRGDKKLLKEFTSMVIEQSTEEIEEMEKALTANNFIELAKAAHSMKNTILSMGFKQQFQELLTAIEIETKKEIPDISTLTKLLHKTKYFQILAIDFLAKKYLD